MIIPMRALRPIKAGQLVVIGRDVARARWYVCAWWRLKNWLRERLTRP